MVQTVKGNTLKKSKSKIPKFESEGEEFDFWSSHDSTEFFHETDEVSERLKVRKPKPRKQRITMLLDLRLKAQLERIAEEKGIPYQTLIRMWLKEKVKQEIKTRLT
jgi:predicted DNA binding CopG/RHH family protein